MIQIRFSYKAALQKTTVNCHYPEISENVSGVVLLAEMMAHLL